MNTSIIKKTVFSEMGLTYDAQIVLDALLKKDSFLFSRYQLTMFNAYCTAFKVEKRVYKTDYYWTVE